MKTVHLVLQAKGGVGKSFIASMLAQFFLSKGDKVNCYDTDPSNKTFGNYQALNVTVIEILTKHLQINTAKFDQLIESILEKDGITVIDNGSGTFIPLVHYLKENNIIELLKDNDINVIVHIPIVGGQATKDTILGLGNVIEYLNTDMVVWSNKYWGEIELDGKAFNELAIYKKNLDKIIQTIELKDYTPDTFGKDIRDMTSNHLTFDEFLSSNEFSLMPKQRIKTVRKDIFTQLEQSPLLLE